jgi:hypothetical protein
MRRQQQQHLAAAVASADARGVDSVLRDLREEEEDRSPSSEARAKKRAALLRIVAPLVELIVEDATRRILENNTAEIKDPPRYFSDYFFTGYLRGRVARETGHS